MPMLLSAFPHNAHRRRAFLTRIGLGGLLLLAGCSNGSELGPVPPYDPSVYKLGAADQLHVIVYGETQLTGDVRVNENGSISLALAGSIEAAGLTSDELATRIADTLKAKEILRNPSVSVEVINFRPVAVLGEVTKPGQLPYQPGMTMLTAVAAAGGFTYRGVQDYAYVIRQAGKASVTGKLLPQDYVKPGDVLKIYERYF